MNNEDNYLMLSGIQHFQFCKRQWALIPQQTHKGLHFYWKTQIVETNHIKSKCRLVLSQNIALAVR